jgi:magnesium-transporting ATPase (P-type)
LEYDCQEQVLLVDGSALTSILNSNNSSLFFERARKAPTVICCRCLPTQKGLITEKLKLLTGTIVYLQSDVGLGLAMGAMMWG